MITREDSLDEKKYMLDSESFISDDVNELFVSHNDLRFPTLVLSQFLTQPDFILFEWDCANMCKDSYVRLYTIYKI